MTLRKQPVPEGHALYWPGIQGRGEFVRLALEEAGADYVDVAPLPTAVHHDDVLAPEHGNQALRRSVYIRADGYNPRRLTPWAINRGTLALSADNDLGAASSGLSFASGALQFLSSFTASRVVTLNTGGARFDFDGNNATLAGLIGGTGDLVKVCAGMLTLSDTNSYSGGTSLDGGTLDLAAVGATGKKTITFAKGNAILKIENAALSADTFGNIICSFGGGDVIDLPGLAFATGATALYNSATHKLAVTSNGVTDTLTLTNPAVTKFVAISDGGRRDRN